MSVENGEVAQLARAFGSYPKGHVFESHLRYQLFKLIIFISQNKNETKEQKINKEREQNLSKKIDEEEKIQEI